LFAGVVLTVAVGFVLYVKGVVNPIRLVIDSLRSDGPIERPRDDKLGFNDIANAVTDFLRRSGTTPPLVLAITAPWGAGKSSLMNLLRHRLRARGVCGVTFNVWHHQQESLLLPSLLNAIREQGLPPFFSWRNFRFRQRLLRQRWRQRPYVGTLCLVFCTYWLYVVLAPVGANLWLAAQESRQVLIPPVCEVADPALVDDPGFLARTNNVLRYAVLAPVCEGVLSDSLSWVGLFFELKFSEAAKVIWSRVASDPAEVLGAIAWMLGLLGTYVISAHFLRVFPERPSVLLAEATRRLKISDLDAQTSFRDRFRQHFRDVSEALQPYTMTIFIDDLDRCRAATCFEMLESINYLVSNGNIFVILGVDREVLLSQVGLCTADVALAAAAAEGPLDVAALDSTQKAQIVQDYAQRYVQKLFQIEIPVPSLESIKREQLPSYDFVRSLWLLARRHMHKLPANGVVTERADGIAEILKDAGSVRVASAWLQHVIAAVGRCFTFVLRFGRLLPYLLLLWIFVWGLANIDDWQLLLAGRQNIFEKISKEIDHDEFLESARKEGHQFMANILGPKLVGEKNSGQAKSVYVLSDTCFDQQMKELPCRTRVDGQLKHLLALNDEIAKQRAALRQAVRVKNSSELTQVRRQWVQWKELIEDHSERFEQLLFTLRPDADKGDGSAAAEASRLKESGPDRAKGKGSVSADMAEGRLPMTDMLGGFGMAAMIFATVVFLMPARFEISDSPEFSAAEEIWRKLLLAVRAKNTPREHNRFINRARYVTERLRRRLRDRPTVFDRIQFNGSQHELSIAEENIVALSAIYTVYDKRKFGVPFADCVLDLARQAGYCRDGVAVKEPPPNAAGLQPAEKNRRMIAECMRKHLDKFPKGAGLTTHDVEVFLDYVGEAHFDDTQEPAVPNVVIAPVEKELEPAV
jgi:hypothetical protein